MTDSTNTNTERKACRKRVVKETEVHDLLEDIEETIQSVETDFVRVTIEPVTAETHHANQQFSQAVNETDHCLGCGDKIDEGGFCGIDCLPLEKSDN